MSGWLPNPDSPKWVRIWSRMGMPAHRPSGNKGHFSKNPVGEERETAEGSPCQHPVRPRSHGLGCLISLLALRLTAVTVYNEKWETVSSTEIYPQIFFFSFLFWLPCGIWRSQARGQIRVAVVTSAIAGATPDSLAHCAGPGIEPASWGCRDAVDPVAPQWELLTAF